MYEMSSFVKQRNIHHILPWVWGKGKLGVNALFPQFIWNFLICLEIKFSSSWWKNIVGIQEVYGGATFMEAAEDLQML